MGLNPVQQYYTPARIQALLTWRNGKPRKRHICEGFCALFGTSECPHQSAAPPKHEYCDIFRIKAQTPVEATQLMDADRDRHRSKFSREFPQPTLRPVAVLIEDRDAE